jgi:hypothetical protein
MKVASLRSSLIAPFFSLTNLCFSFFICARSLSTSASCFTEKLQWIRWQKHWGLLLRKAWVQLFNCWDFRGSKVESLSRSNCFASLLVQILTQRRMGSLHQSQNTTIDFHLNRHREIFRLYLFQQSRDRFEYFCKCLWQSLRYNFASTGQSKVQSRKLQQ